MFESWYLGQKLINIGENLVLEVIPAYLLELKKKTTEKEEEEEEKIKRKKTREIRPDAKALAKTSKIRPAQALAKMG